MNKSEFLNMQKQVKNARRSRTPRSAKYKNQKIECDGLKFDSKKEAQRYKVLRDMQKDGVIGELQCQTVFILADAVKYSGEPRKKPALRYLADFTYTLNGALVVEDVKSDYTRSLPAYRIKKHLMMSVHGIEISEV